MTSIRKGNNNARRARERALYAPRHVLVDPRPIRAENPHSFYLPCQERLDAISIGDRVKLIFEPTHGGPSERMWVLVGSARPGDDELGGILMNQPAFIEDLMITMPVAFRRHHVIDIETTRADDPEETNRQPEGIFARCLMDARVYRDEIPAVRLVRDAAQPADFPRHPGDHAFGWGGWRIEGEGFEPGMETEIGTPVIALRHKDATDFSHLLAASEGSAFTLVDGAWKLT